MPKADVVVVGAGPAGLATAACLGRRGFRAVVLERDAELGRRWARRHDSLRLHTVRRFSGLPHLPLPKSLPRYVGKDDFAVYLREYAERLELDVRLGVEVRAIRSGWEVETDGGVWRSSAVVIATGRHDLPVVPDWPGRERYRGRLLHSSEFRSGAGFRGQDVLVVGLGNSGADLVLDLAGHGARVSLAVRSVPPISRRELGGVPVQVLGMLCAPLPPHLVDRVGARLRPRLALGPSDWGPLTARRPPVIDTGFVELLEGGLIEVRPAVERLTEMGAAFVDGSSGEFDAILAATGYRPGPLTGATGVHVVGMHESVRGGIFELSHDARRVARRIARELRP